MGIYVEINGVQYPASITGTLNDKDWNNRESKSITLEMNYSDAMSIFVDDVEWSIVQEYEEYVEEYNNETDDVVSSVVIRNDYYDNSEYSIAGSITDHRNGNITVKMGKPTSDELLEMLVGGIVR